MRYSEKFQFFDFSQTLEKLKNQDRAHITMITFWLLEIYEKQLADVKYNDSAANELRKLQRNFDELLALPNAYVRIS